MLILIKRSQKEISKEIIEEGRIVCGVLYADAWILVK
jgi:hypothetical protein